jgi:hypothetical protein
MQYDNQHLLDFGVEIDFDWRNNEENRTLKLNGYVSDFAVL